MLDSQHAALLQSQSLSHDKAVAAAADRAAAAELQSADLRRQLDMAQSLVEEKGAKLEELVQQEVTEGELDAL